MCSLTDVKCLSEPSVTSELYQPKQLMIRSCFWSAEPVFSDTATAECGNKEKNTLIFHRLCCCDESAEPERKGVNLLVDIDSVPVLNCGHENHIADTSTGKGLPLKGASTKLWSERCCSSTLKGAIWGGLGIWLEFLLDPSYMTCFRHFLLRGGVVMDPGPAGEIISLSWIGNTSLSWTSRGRHGKISSLNLKQRKPVHSLVLISYNVTVDLSMWISHQIPFAFPFS